MGGEGQSDEDGEKSGPERRRTRRSDVFSGVKSSLRLSVRRFSGVSMTTSGRKSRDGGAGVGEKAQRERGWLSGSKEGILARRKGYIRIATSW